MATFYTDFSEYTDSVQPSDWTKRWNTAETWLVTLSGVDGEASVRPNGGSVPSGLTWDDVGSPTTDIDILVKIDLTTTSTLTSVVGLYLSGGAGTETGYLVQLYHFYERINIVKYAAGTPTTLDTQDNVFVDNSVNFMWVRVQLLVDTPGAGDVTVRAKWWEDGESEPAGWGASGADTASVLSPGPIGLGEVNVSTETHTYQFGVGTNGDTAPGVAPSTPTETVTDVLEASAKVTGSAFSGGSGTHGSTQLQVATDSGFTAVIYDETFEAADVDDLTVLLASFLPPATSLYARIRYSDDMSIWSGWSAGENFTTGAANAPDTPTLYLTDQTTTGVQLNTSAYSDTDGEDHVATEWNVATDSGFTAIVFDTDADFQNLLERIVSELAASTTYYCRARHIDARLVASSWSTTVSFTTNGGSGAPGTPTVTLNTKTTTSATLDVTGSDFAADWIISEDSTFAKLHDKKLGSVTSQAQHQFTSLFPNTTYYVTARKRNADFAITSPWATAISFTTDAVFGTAMQPTAPAPLASNAAGNITVSWDYTPTGNEVVDLDYSDDYGASWTSVVTGETGTSYVWDASALAAGTNHLLRLNIRDTVTSEEGPYRYIPIGIAGSGLAVYGDDAATRVSDADTDLSEWTDKWRSSDGTWDGALASGYFRHQGTNTSGLGDMHALQRDDVPAGIEFDGAVRLRIGSKGEYTTSGMQAWGYWDQETAGGGIGFAILGEDGVSAESGIFASIYMIPVYDYDGVVQPAQRALGIGRAVGLLDLSVGTWTNGIITNSVGEYPMGYLFGQYLARSQVEWYTIRMRTDIEATNPDGTYDIRVRVAVYGRGVDDVSGYASPWHVNEVIENVNISAGKVAMLGFHGANGSWSHLTGFREFESMFVWTGAPDTETPAESPAAAPEGCPVLDSEKVRYLDRRVSWNSTGVSAAYDSGADATTWTFPYEVNTDQATDGELAVVHQNNDTVYTVTRPAVNQVTVTGQGDLTVAPVFIGVLYNFSWTPTTLFPREGEVRPDDRARLQIHWLDVRYHDSTDLTVTVSTTGRSDVAYTADLAALADGRIHIPVLTRNTEASFVVSNGTPGGCALSSLEWEGLLRNRSERYR